MLFQTFEVEVEVEDKKNAAHLKSSNVHILRKYRNFTNDVVFF